jgi:hypothetical protein
MRCEGQVFRGWKRRIGPRFDRCPFRKDDGLAMVEQADALDQRTAAIGRGLEDVLVNALPV